MSTVSPETTATAMTAATKENFSMFMLLSSAIDSSQGKYSTTHPNRQTAFRDNGFPHVRPVEWQAACRSTTIHFTLRRSLVPLNVAAESSNSGPK